MRSVMEKGERRDDDDRPSFLVYKIRSHFACASLPSSWQNHEKKRRQEIWIWWLPGVGSEVDTTVNKQQGQGTHIAIDITKKRWKRPFILWSLRKIHQSESNGYIFFKKTSKISAKHDCCTKNTTEVWKQARTKPSSGWLNSQSYQLEGAVAQYPSAHH